MRAPSTLELIISLKAAATAGIGERLFQVVLGAEHEVDRKDPGFRLQGCRVRGRGDAEIDIARAQLLQDLRLLPELGAGKLVDEHRAVAQLGELTREGVAGDAVGGRMRLVVGEAEMARLVGKARTEPNRNSGSTNRQSHHNPASAHRSLPLDWPSPCLGPWLGAHPGARRRDVKRLPGRAGRKQYADPARALQADDKGKSQEEDANDERIAARFPEDRGGRCGRRGAGARSRTRRREVDHAPPGNLVHPDLR